MTHVAAVIAQLENCVDPAVVVGMKRYGITPGRALGISLYVLREIAGRTGVDHSLALDLWDCGIHEAYILASMVDDPALVTEAQMERWVKDFDSWDICDQVTSNLFDKTPFAYSKAIEWAGREEEFVKRAAFATMAALAVQDKAATNEQLEPFFEIIVSAACDDRNFVKKAVNWALRNLGKRNLELNHKAIETAHRIKGLDCRAARWIASDALRELESDKIQARVAKRS